MFDEFEWMIVAEFFDPTDAYDFEQTLIYENWENPLGLNQSCSYNNRLRFSTIGNKHTDETKAKISNGQRGDKNHRHGKKLSPEHKVALVNSEKVLTDAGRKRISETHKGKIVSRETRELQSARKKGIPLTPEHKDNLSRSSKGKVKSQSHKNNISASLKGKPKPKVVCRITDHKEMDITNFVIWANKQISI